MLVEQRAVEREVGPVEHLARALHRAGQRRRLGARHAAEEDRHGEGGDLPLGDRAVAEAAQEGGDLGGVELDAVALAADDLLRQDI